MNISEHFNDWWPLIDKTELSIVVSKVDNIYKRVECSPAKPDIFKAFRLCSRRKCKVIFIGQDPYPQRGVATGLLFANSKEQKILSPSLNIVKNCILDLENPHKIRIFDQTFESIAEQGVLLLNSALTVEIGKPGSHQLMWLPFIQKFLVNVSEVETGIIYVLFGNNAKALKPFIGKYNHIIECIHPAYCARNDLKLPDVFTEVNKILLSQYGECIHWCEEL